MKTPKLALSSAEWQLACSTEVILTKNKIIQDVYVLFGELSNRYRQYTAVLNDKLPEIFSIHPKISRGENYEGMPWVMLDYPRQYSQEHGHFAIRCFFWWGHFFSISLQLSGKYLQQYHPALPILEQQGWWVGCTDLPWNHELPNANWLPYDASGIDSENEMPAFGKAAKKIPVTEWPQVPDFLAVSFAELIEALHAHY